MKIVHFLDDIRLESGGVVRAVLDYVKLLAARGHEVTLVTLHAQDVPASWREGGAGLPRVVELPRDRRSFGLMSKAGVEAFERVLREAEVLHLHGPWERTNAQAAGAARRLGVGYVLSVHGMLDEWSVAQEALKKKVYHALVARRMLGGAAVVHVTADDEGRQAARWIPKGPAVEVLPILVDFDDYRELPEASLALERIEGVPAEGPRVLFLSRVHPKKGVENAIGMLPMLAERGHRPSLLIAGTGPSAYRHGLEALATELAVRDRVHFLGMVKGMEKIALYRLCDVYVLPTSQENFGIVLPEALACETPVVTTKGTDIWREIEGSGGGVIVEQRPEGFAKAVGDLLDDEERRAAMGRAGREWVFRHLDPERILDGLEAVYGRAAANP